MVTINNVLASTFTASITEVWVLSAVLATELTQLFFGFTLQI